jgi:hypothetical protein
MSYVATAMPGHVERRHPERKRRELERFLAAEKRFPSEGVSSVMA